MPFVIGDGVYNSASAFLQPSYAVARSGLILQLDTNNINSYPTEGTGWFDLSLLQQNFTLVNGPTFTSGQPSYLNFDGTNDQATGTVTGVDETAGAFNTVEMWFYWTGGYGGFPMEFSSYRLWMPNGNLGFNNGNGDCYGIDFNSYVNQWVHMCAVFYNGVYTNNSKIYINAVNQTLSQRLNSETSGTANSQVTIAGYRGSTTAYPFPGRIAYTAIYNRQLIQTEVTNNYNVQRARFGV